MLTTGKEVEEEEEEEGRESLCYYCIVAMLQLNGQIAFIYLSPATTICAMFLIECIKRRAPTRLFSSSNGKRIILLMSYAAAAPHTAAAVTHRAVRWRCTAAAAAAPRRRFDLSQAFASFLSA